MIPKIIHQAWFGEIPDRIQKLMDTWKKVNPDFEYILWKDEDLHKLDSPLIPLLDAVKEYAGKGDVARNIVLSEMGGFYVDCDALAINPVSEDMLRHDCFACYENEFCRGQLLAGGFLASTKDSFYLKKLNELFLSYDLDKINKLGLDRAWEFTGPVPMTYVWKKYHCTDLMIYPSWYFIPNHYNFNKVREGYICDHIWRTDYDYKKYCMEFIMSENPIIWNECRLIEELKK